ncbi:unnamed protein product [Strongylus vulgaris]|uniref:Uncharacterized protein n=1 Tax=Strongylus vulgaris TaxID=40348 RepID=A0A3P7IU16_STRVU|nr:unnamed protein product [Strongylus vulgaris]
MEKSFDTVFNLTPRSTYENSDPANNVENERNSSRASEGSKQNEVFDSTNRFSSAHEVFQAGNDVSEAGKPSLGRHEDAKLAYTESEIGGYTQKKFEDFMPVNNATQTGRYFAETSEDRGIANENTTETNPFLAAINRDLKQKTNATGFFENYEDVKPKGNTTGNNTHIHGMFGNLEPVIASSEPGGTPIGRYESTNKLANSIAELSRHLSGTYDELKTTNSAADLGAHASGRYVDAKMANDIDEPGPNVSGRYELSNTLNNKNDTQDRTYGRMYDRVNPMNHLGEVSSTPRKYEDMKMMNNVFESRGYLSGRYEDMKPTSIVVDNNGYQPEKFELVRPLSNFVPDEPKVGGVVPTKSAIESKGYFPGRYGESAPTTNSVTQAEGYPLRRYEDAKPSSTVAEGNNYPSERRPDVNLASSAVAEGSSFIGRENR